MSSQSRSRDRDILWRVIELGLETANAIPDGGVKGDTGIQGHKMLGVGMHVTPAEMDRIAGQAMADFDAISGMLRFSETFIQLEQFGALVDELFTRLLAVPPSDFEQNIKGLSAAMQDKFSAITNPDLEVARLVCFSQRFVDVVVKALKSRRQ